MSVKYLTSISHIQIMCREIGLDFEKITNFYNLGSHVHGTATQESDYDILIVGDFHDDPLKFNSVKYPYHYDFKMYNIKIEGIEYDVKVHSNKNYEIDLIFPSLPFSFATFPHIIK